VFVGTIAAIGIGFLAPIMTEGFTVAPLPTVQPHVAWTVAGVLTVFSVFAIWAAYHRWLVTDFD
jgi:hypothetical protein